jgi:hypothetical protein
MNQDNQWLHDIGVQPCALEIELLSGYDSVAKEACRRAQAEAESIAPRHVFLHDIGDYEIPCCDIQEWHEQHVARLEAEDGLERQIRYRKRVEQTADTLTHILIAVTGSLLVVLTTWCYFGGAL